MSWRDELVEAVKTQAEREQEEKKRRQERLDAALAVADEAHEMVVEALEFAQQQISDKGQSSTLEPKEGALELALGELAINVTLTRDDAVLTVSYNQTRPRAFDFMHDRHLAPKDVEEYVGRRVVELVRAAQKEQPW